MRQPEISACLRERVGRTAGSGLAALGFILLLLPAVALSADPQQDKPEEKKPPAKPAAAPLRFTDEDLEKYHKPKPADEEEATAGETEVEEEPAGGAPKAPQAAPPAPALPKQPQKKPRQPQVRTPARAEKPPAEDPLKRWKDREALETFRNNQIGGLRERIATLQSRLGYLEQKRLAVIDPLRIMPSPRTAEEGAEDAARKPRELLEAVEAEIESVKTDLEQAKRDLITVETRFEQEMAPR